MFTDNEKIKFLKSIAIEHNSVGEEDYYARKTYDNDKWEFGYRSRGTDKNFILPDYVVISIMEKLNIEKNVQDKVCCDNCRFNNITPDTECILCINLDMFEQTEGECE